VEWIAKGLGRAADSPAIDKVAEEQERMWNQEVRLFPDALYLLHFLKDRGVPVAILSNGPVAMRNLVKNLEIEDCIDKFMLSCDWGCMKPDGEIYEKCLAELGTSAEKCIFAGDGNDRELEGANKAGLFAVKLVRTELTFADPDGMSRYWDTEVDSLTALKDLIEENLR
jgi:putative hydrolase of the HAD superfamily